MITMKADFNHRDGRGRLILSDLVIHEHTPFAEIAGAGERILFVQGEDIVEGVLVHDEMHGWVGGARPRPAPAGGGGGASRPEAGSIQARPGSAGTGPPSWRHRSRPAGWAARRCLAGRAPWGPDLAPTPLGARRAAPEATVPQDRYSRGTRRIPRWSAIRAMHDRSLNAKHAREIWTPAALSPSDSRSGYATPLGRTASA